MTGGMRVAPRPNLKVRSGAVVDADGHATVEITPTSAWPWVVRQVSIELTGTTPVGATAVMRDNGAFVTRMIAGGDVADGDPPVPLDVGESLTIEWEGAGPGQTARVLALYDEVAATS